jgi:catechol-2,3-dioxygenase
MSPLAWHGQLSHIALACPNVDASAAFYADVVGLTREPAPPGPEQPGRARLGWGTGQHALDLLPGEPALDHFALEIPDPDELDALVAHIRRSGTEVTEVDGAGDEPRSRRLLDPQGRTIELHGRVDRSGEHGADPGRRPVRLQHITLAAIELDEVVDFYVRTMRFTISDRMGDVFVWLRCGVEHHTVAVVRSGAPIGLDHFSFDLDAWQDFKVWCDRLADHGHEVSWGPGRHGPGNNLFIMFDDPAGYHVELSSEMERYFDELATYEPRVWSPTTRTVNLWGPVPSWRAAQVPDPTDAVTA